MKFKNNIPYLEKGIDLRKVAFSGGRLTATIANHGGLMQVDYYGEQRFGDSSLFTGSAITAWPQLFRACLGIDDNLYYLEFQDTRFFPFGYTSHFTAEGIKVRHGLYLLNDALLYRIEVLRNPRKRKISAVLFQMNGVTRVQKPTRKWIDEGPISSDNVWEATVVDQHTEPSKAPANFGLPKGFPTEQVMRSETSVAVTCDHSLNFEYPNHFKNNLRTAPFQEDVTFCVVFGHTKSVSFHKRVKTLRRSAPAEVAQLLAGYRDSLQTPAISFTNAAVQSCIANTHAMLDAVKPKDFSGALRGANNGYWVWGWDTLVYTHAHPLLGDGLFAAQMLEFFRSHSDPDIGIAHSFTLDQKPFLPMAFNAQCLYAISLYDVYLFSGDRKILETYFDFALELVNRAGRDEINGTGLVKGPSLYPDAVDTLGETGDDISAINNSIYYQSLRAMSALARELDLKDVETDLSHRAERLQKNFDRLYDRKKGFFYTSISASDFKPRKFYAAHIRHGGFHVGPRRILGHIIRARPRGPARRADCGIYQEAPDHAPRVQAHAKMGPGLHAGWQQQRLLRPLRPPVLHRGDETGAEQSGNTAVQRRCRLVLGPTHGPRSHELRNGESRNHRRRSRQAATFLDEGMGLDLFPHPGRF